MHGQNHIKHRTCWEMALLLGQKQTFRFRKCFRNKAGLEMKIKRNKENSKAWKGKRKNERKATAWWEKREREKQKEKRVENGRNRV